MRKQKKQLLNQQRKSTGIETKKQEKKRLHKEGKNRHHRLPKSLGGTRKNGNLSVVPVVLHRAFHLLFGRHPPPVIAQILNTTWLPLDTCLIPIETANISEATRVLYAAGLIETKMLFAYGITDDHLRYHGTPDERVQRTPQYGEKKKRPDS